MLFTFIKKDGLMERVGGESSVTPELQEVLKTWSEAGWEPASAEEWDQQMLKSCSSGEKLPDAEPAAE